MSGIRVTYTGFIAFGGRILSVFTGLAFTLIVTRQLNIEEFGTWGLINGVIIYALVIHPIISYWSTRETARGETTGKTAIISTGFFSGIGITIYLIIGYIVGMQSNVDVNIILLATILVPVIFINEGLNAIIFGFKPHVRSFGFITFEIVKIPAALLLIYHFQFGVEGAIISSFISYLASIILLFVYAKEKIKNQFSVEPIKKWIKLSWVPIYRKMPGLLSQSDVVVFSVITGSVIGIAYYSAARTIGFLVNHSRTIGSGVYPKLLEGGHEKILQNNLNQFFFVAMPIMGTSIVFAKPGLFALNPIYEIGVPIVIFLTLRQFLTSINSLLFSALQGIEKVDIKKDSNYKDYVKSKLVLFPTFQMIRHGVYIGSLIIIFAIIGIDEAEINLVIYWAIIGLLVEIPLTVYIINLTKKSFSLKINLLSISKYLITTIIIFGLIFVLMDEFLVYENNIFKFLPILFMYMITGILSYLGVNYIIDKNTKSLVKAIFKELRGMKNGK